MCDKECLAMQRCLPNTVWAEFWAWPHSLSSVAFIWERRESGLLLPLKMSPTFDLVLHSRLKNEAMIAEIQS